MQHLVMVGRQATIPASYLHPGSLACATHYPPADPAMQHNLRVWERIDRDPPTLEAWAETRARALGIHKLWPFWAMEYDTVLVRLLEERGFVTMPGGIPAPLFERTLHELPKVRLPDGFSIHDVRTPDDGRLRAQVAHGAFGSTTGWETWGTCGKFPHVPHSIHSIWYLIHTDAGIVTLTD